MSVGQVFAYLYTLDDDSEHPMDYETSLLRKVFPLHREDIKSVYSQCHVDSLTCTE